MFAFTFRKFNIINKLMASARMSRHLFISFIFDRQSGEKHSNTEYFANTYSSIQKNLHFLHTLLSYTLNLKLTKWMVLAVLHTINP